MKISYSRFSAFLQNPERYRMHYVLGLKTVSDDIPSVFNYGRRRGSCVHAIHEARAKGLRDSEITKHLFPQEMYERCVRMVEIVPTMELLPGVCETAFTCGIGNGTHQIEGRIDHAFRESGEIWLGDLKSTKGKTKKEMRKYFGELDTSPQAHFYLYAAALLGFGTDKLRYHVIVDNGKEAPDYVPVDVRFGPSAVDRKMKGVQAACEGILGYLSKIGEDKPWPHSNIWPCNGDRAFCGFAEICEHVMPKGCVPPGFVSRHPEETESI